MKIGIIGGGESGVGAALLALKNGDVPFVSDYGKIEDGFKNELIQHNVRFEESGHTIDILVESDIIVKSPGVPGNVSVIKKLREISSVQILSEIEYASRYCKGLIIAITGSNGKTTITNLIHHLLVTAGVDAVKGGNLGTSLSKLLLDDRDHSHYVVEVSSFQLDDVVSFKPGVGMIINITPDHLDRYDGVFDNYKNAKLRIATNQSSEDLFLFHESVKQDAIVIGGGQKITISNDDLIAGRFELDNSYLRGFHNSINASFAIETVKYLGVDDQVIQSGLNSFINDDHRMQSVGMLHGAEWINDSKATNVDAAFYALQAIKGKLIWIAGGVDKGNDYDQLKFLVDEKVKCLICLGVDNAPLMRAFGDIDIEVIEVSSMTEAVNVAYDQSERGDTVLLSPACASFDLFKNYKDRGDQFMTEVKSKMKTSE